MGTNLWIGYEGTGEGSGKRGVQWTPATRRVSTCSVNIVEGVSLAPVSWVVLSFEC